MLVWSDARAGRVSGLEELAGAYEGRTYQQNQLSCAGLLRQEVYSPLAVRTIVPRFSQPHWNDSI